jgi:WhiB family redox-sensing transcriptional regulator
MTITDSRPATRPATNRDDWRNNAACKADDPELWFPVGDSGPARLQANHAKSICHSCPAIAPCLQWAMDTGQDSGIWGGLTEDERRALRQKDQNR